MLERGKMYWGEYEGWRYALHLQQDGTDTLYLFPYNDICYAYELQTGSLKELDKGSAGITDAELLDYIAPYTDINALMQRIVSIKPKVSAGTLERGKVYRSSFLNSNKKWECDLHLGEDGTDTLYLHAEDGACLAYELQTGSLKELDKGSVTREPHTDILYTVLLDYIAPYINIDVLMRRIVDLQFENWFIEKGLISY